MKFGLLSRRQGLIIPLLSLALAFSGCGRSPQAQRDKGVARGKQLLQRRDYARAILEFKNAARAVPNDAEVYYQLGLAYGESKEFRSALAAFRRALALNPRHVEAQLRIAQMQAATNNEALLKDAQGRLKALLETASPTPEMLNTLAFTELKLGNPDAAMQGFERALAQSPGELTASIMLARTKLSRKDVSGAEQVLQKAASDVPKSTDARRVLGEFYGDQKRLPEAEAEFRRALRIQPNSGAALFDLARLLLIEGRKPEAEQSFQQLARLDTYKSIYARFLFQEGRREDAVREFEKVAKENPEDRGARTNLVAAYRATGRAADADKLLEGALRKNPKDADALLERGEIALSAGKYGPAEADFDKVRSLRPMAPEVHYLLARLHQARGAALSYRQELSETLRLSPSLESARAELAQSFLKDNGARAALEVLNAAPESQKWSTPILIERNWALWMLGDTAEMRKGIDRGLARERSADLLIQDGMWKLRSGDPAGARAALEEALKMDPADLRALAALKQTYVAQKSGSLALQKVKEYAARQPKSAPIQDFLGTMLAADGDRVKARAAFDAAKAADPFFEKADLSLAQLDALEGKLDAAHSRLQAVLAAHNGNLTARLWLGNIEELSGNHTAAIEHFRRVVDANPNNAQASNNLAYLLSEYANQPDEALKYAEKAVELVPERRAYCDTLGWVLYQKGVYSSAIKYLEQATSNQGNVVWKYHLAMAYAKGGNASRGRTTLEAALRLNPNLPEAAMARQVVGSSH